MNSPSRSSKSKPDRANRIIEMVAHLRGGKPILIGETAKRFGVSQPQIRQDIEFIEELLEDLKGIARLPGEVRPVRDPHADSFVTFRRQQHRTEKDMIAEYAVECLIENGDHLLLDSGTTIRRFVKRLLDRGKTGIRAVSAAADFEELFLPRPDAAYVQLGGLLNQRALTFHDGYESFSTGNHFQSSNCGFIEEYCAREGLFKAVVTGTGFSLERGLATNTTHIASIKKAMIKAASQVILLIDHSKFAKGALETISHLGMKPDDYLKDSKPAVIVIDAPEDGRLSPTFHELSKRLKKVSMTAEKKDYEGKVMVFETELIPSSKR